MCPVAKAKKLGNRKYASQVGYFSYSIHDIEHRIYFLQRLGAIHNWFIMFTSGFLWNKLEINYIHTYTYKIHMSTYHVLFYAPICFLIRHGENIDMNNKSAMPLGIWILPLNVNHSVIRRRKTWQALNFRISTTTNWHIITWNRGKNLCLDKWIMLQ